MNFKKFSTPICITLIALTGIFLLISQTTNAATAITDLTIVEKEGVTSNNYPLTFGHVFKKGDVPNSIQVVLNGQELQTQFDVKRHWGDGSVKHGVISVIIPEIEANSSLTLELQTKDGTNNSDPMNKTEILNTGVESKIKLTNLSGSGYEGSLTGSLNEAISQADSLNYWLEGSVCTEILPEQHLNRGLDATWEARFYPDTEYGIRVSNTIENVNAKYRGNVNYAVSILTGVNGTTSTAYTKSKFQHNHSSRWRKVLWIGNEPPEVETHYNLDYLISTGAIMNYDTSLQVPESTISNQYDSWQNSDHDIMGTGYIETYFNTTGGRPDIGILPEWTARYLLSMDNRMKGIMLNHAEMAAGTPVHYEEFNPNMSAYGNPISIDDRPKVRTTAKYASDSTYGDLPDAIGDTDTQWDVDLAHQPSFAFMPYLVTGEKFYLDEMLYWGSWNLSQSNYNSDWGRDYSKGLLRSSARSEAWASRNIADASAFAPDNSSMGEYLAEKINNNISEWMSEKDRYPLKYWGVMTYAYPPFDGFKDYVSKVTSPWMNDFMLVSLAHLNQLGFNTKQILDWFGTSFTIQRFTNEDFNPYNGTSYRFPAKFDDGTYPQTWAEADAAYSNQPTSFPEDDYPYSYRFVAMAAVSCLTDYPDGQEAYNFLKNNVNDQNELNTNPKWALVPRSDTDGGDTTPPTRSNASPSGELSSSTTQTDLSLTTNETATCGHSTSSNVSYSDMIIFDDTNSIDHSTNVTGLTDGNSYTYYVRCEDKNGNINTTDYEISFSVASSTDIICGDNTCASSETPSSCPEDCSPEGDLNRDGKVDSSDFGVIIGKWRNTTNLGNADLNGDGVVDAQDMGILMSHWARGTMGQ